MTILAQVSRFRRLFFKIQREERRRSKIFSPLEVISEILENGYYNYSLVQRIRYESEKRGTNDFTANLAICLALRRIARNTCSSLRLDTIALERIARAVAAKCNASSRRLRAP